MYVKRVSALSVCGAAAVLLLATHAATAQSSTGTITGRVLWGGCIRAIPLPAQPDVTPPSAQAQPQPVTPQSGLPAGAVLVAVQSTGVSTRTDEAGSFSLSNVPAGQYLTVAAGPVANATNAIAERPNVFVNGGQSVDVGTLNLGGGPTLGFPCRVLPGAQGAATGGDVAPTPMDQPPDNNP